MSYFQIEWKLNFVVWRLSDVKIGESLHLKSIKNLWNFMKKWTSSPFSSKVFAAQKKLIQELINWKTRLIDEKWKTIGKLFCGKFKWVFNIICLQTIFFDLFLWKFIKVSFIECTDMLLIQLSLYSVTLRDKLLYCYNFGEKNEGKTFSQ